ncbi:MAG TPA: tyrosine-type recombinase/integrase, partial [Candidatus Methylacidiphilales bacterium]
MATIYQRKGSPYWWVKWQDEKSQYQYESTGYRNDDADGKRKAQIVKLAKAKNELQRQRGAGLSHERWANWVLPFLEMKHRNVPRTFQAYKGRWEWLYLYLTEKGIDTPRALTYEDCLAYLPWRMNYKKKSKKKVSSNTARHDLKLLGKICKEAVRREFTDKNVAYALGIPLMDSKEKPEITNEEILKIRQALVDQKELGWMSRSFEIALATGVRLRKTQIQYSNVNFQRGEITYPAPKGGRKRAFTAPIVYPHLLTLLKKWKADGGTQTLSVGKMPSKKWREFLDGLGLKHLCFHCTRVTFITRFCRAGNSETVCMKLVNHASEEIHRIYQRLSHDDVLKMVKAP